MCLETMDTNSKHIKTNCLRKTMKAGSKLKWRLLRVSAEEDDEAFKQCRTSAVRATVRKYLRREQRRAQLAKLVLGDLGKKEKMESAYEESPAAARVHRHPPGAMAPENTTQYLMGNVYEDQKTDHTVPVQTSAHLYDESLSPRSVYAALDSGYESCLAFQQRDFEEVFNLCW